MPSAVFFLLPNHVSTDDMGNDFGRWKVSFFWHVLHSFNHLHSPPTIVILCEYTTTVWKDVWSNFWYISILYLFPFCKNNFRILMIQKFNDYSVGPSQSVACNNILFICLFTLILFTTSSLGLFKSLLSSDV